jgi:peptidyl-prolyl cis-trans isomerase A (cyclophilin A)
MIRRRYLLSVLFLLTSLASSLAGTLAQFRTVLGDIELELYDHDKPVTVRNFIRYVQSGAYTNMFAHRLLPGFVVQGGGFSVSNNTLVPIPTSGEITNEFAVGQRFSNTYGTIAMAKRAGDTNSANSQWFINLADNSFLDANDTNNLFVVFGHVLRGTNVLSRLNAFQYYTGSQTSNLVLHQIYAPPYDDLPLLRPSLDSTNLLHVEITLLEVSISPSTGGAQRISWNSATDLTNIVEFTTSFPPVWTTLVRTNGNGSQISVQDNGGSSSRFYRIRVE